MPRLGPRAGHAPAEISPAVALSLLLLLPPPLPGAAGRTLKIGMVCNYGPEDYTWCYRHNVGRLWAIDELLRSNPSLEIETRYEFANEYVFPDKIHELLGKLGEEGYDVVFATSSGMRPMVVAQAQNYPNTNFVHVSGYNSHHLVEEQNVMLAWTRMYQARYLSGMAAASKTQSGKIAYAAAMPIPEVVRGINGFTLGARRMLPSVTVEVVMMAAWSNIPKTTYVVRWLLSRGNDVVAGHTNDMELWQEARNAGKLSVGYYTKMREVYGDSLLTSAYFTWGPMYFRFANSTLHGRWGAVRGSGQAFEGMDERTCDISPLNPSITYADRTKIEDAKQALMEGADVEPGGGSGMIFCGSGGQPLLDHTGAQIYAAGQCATQTDLLDMQYFVEGVYYLGDATTPWEACPAGARWELHPTEIPMKYTCITCGAGTYSANPHELSPPDPATYFGDYLSPGFRDCLPCPAGEYGAGNAVNCTPCPNGWHSPEPGASACTPCPSLRTNVGTGNAACNVEIAEDDQTWIWVIVAVGGLMLITIPPAAWKFTANKRRMMMLYNNNEIACSCAESIAQMKLDEVAYIREIPNPNKIQTAFITIIDTLVEYRRYLPASVLAGKDDDDDESNHSDAVSHDNRSRGSRGLKRGISGSGQFNRGTNDISDGSSAGQDRRKSRQHRLNVAAAARADDKFKLVLNKKKAACGAIQLWAARRKEEEANNDLLQQIEVSVKGTKGYIQVLNGWVLVTWNTVMNTTMPAQQCAIACSKIRDAWKKEGKTELGVMQIGASMSGVLCGNIGTEVSRHYVVVRAQAVSSALLFAAYGGQNLLDIVSDDYVVRDARTAIQYRQVDYAAVHCNPRPRTQQQSGVTPQVTPQTSAATPNLDSQAAKSPPQGGLHKRGSVMGDAAADDARVGGIYEIIGLKKAADEDEWMYQMQQQEAAGQETFAAVFTAAWKAVQGGDEEKAAGQREKVEAAALREEKDLRGDAAWVRLCTALDGVAAGAPCQSSISSFGYDTPGSAHPSATPLPKLNF